MGGAGDGGRSYERITPKDLDRLAEISRQDREDFFARKPRYLVLEERLACVALCQGAALHFVDGENGVKDFDVWTFYAARPAHPAFPWRRRVARDFGDPRFGRTPNTAGFVGRRVDLLGRSIEVGEEGDPAAALAAYLSEKAAPPRPAPSRGRPPSCSSPRTGGGPWCGLPGNSRPTAGPGDRLSGPSCGEEAGPGVALEGVRASFRRQA